MSKPNKRKQKKKLQRKRANRGGAFERMKRLRESLSGPPLPKISIDAVGAPTELVSIVQEHVRRIRLDDENLFSPQEVSFFRTQAKRGYEFALSAFRNAHAEGGIRDDILFASQFALLSSLGRTLFELIGEETLLRFIPYSDICAVPVGREWYIQLRSLERQSSIKGTIYSSSSKPTIVTSEGTKTVGFRYHAIQRICDRVVPTWRTYTGLGDAFAFLNTCKYFEPVCLSNGHLAFTFYEMCVDRFRSNRYFEEIIGGKKGGNKYYFRVGYCPADVDGDYVAARSLLIPGFGGTPERALLERASMSSSQRARFRRLIEKAQNGVLMESGDFEALKWFHDNGIPQVVTLEREVY